MPNASDTSDSDPDAPLPPNTDVYSYSGSGTSWFDIEHIPTNVAICWLPGWFLNIEAGRRRRVLADTHWQVKEVVNFLIHWLPDQYINGNAETPIDGHKSTGGRYGLCLFQIRDINMHLLIYQSINWSINWQTKQMEGNISRTADIRTHYLINISTETWRPLSADTNWRTYCVYLKPQTWIFTHLLINQSIDKSTNLSTNGRNIQRDTSVRRQKEGHITWQIYQRRRGDAYWQTQINVKAVSISNPRHQYSPIDLLVYQFIDLSMERQNGQRDTSVVQ